MKTSCLILMAVATASAQTQLTINSQTVARAWAADLGSALSVAQQWDKKLTAVKYAWDQSTNCYSEFWKTAGVISTATVECGPSIIKMSEGKCTNQTKNIPPPVTPITPPPVPPSKNHTPASPPPGPTH